MMSDKRIIRIDSVCGPIDIQDDFYNRIERTSTENKTSNRKKEHTLKKYKSFNEYLDESYKKR